MSERTPTRPAASKWTVIERVLDIWERGDPFSPAVFFLALLVVIVMVRVPGEMLGEALSVLARWLALQYWLLGFSLALHGVSVLIFIRMRDGHRAELKRMADQKRQLELAIDPNRPETGIDDKGKRRRDQ